jgi:hypothetical protein
MDNWYPTRLFFLEDGRIMSVFLSNIFKIFLIVYPNVHLEFVDRPINGVELSTSQIAGWWQMTS